MRWLKVLCPSPVARLLPLGSRRACLFVRLFAILYNIVQKVNRCGETLKAVWACEPRRLLGCEPVRSGPLSKSRSLAAQRGRANCCTRRQREHDLLQAPPGGHRSTAARYRNVPPVAHSPAAGRPASCGDPDKRCVYAAAAASQRTLGRRVSAPLYFSRRTGFAIFPEGSRGSGSGSIATYLGTL